MSQPQEDHSRNIPAHNVVDTLVDGVNMRGITGPGGENNIGVQRQVYPAGSIPLPRMRDTPSRTEPHPQEQTTPARGGLEGRNSVTYNIVFLNVIGVNVQGIASAGGVNHIGEQHQTVDSQAFQKQQHPQPISHSQGKYTPFTSSGRVNSSRTTVSGFNIEGMASPGGHNQINLQEQIFVSMQNQGQTIAPMQNQERSPVPVQRQEQARLERALALLSAHPQILDALERINTGYQTQGAGPQVSATLNFVQ